jgi:hypothetical protein
VILNRTEQGKLRYSSVPVSIRVGSYWEKGNQNEIDLVAVNDIKKEIVVAEIKMNPSKINTNVNINYKAFS